MCQMLQALLPRVRQQGAAAVISQLQLAKLNGSSHTHLRDVMDKEPTWSNSRFKNLHCDT
jgi:hypothetical protein